MDGLSIRCVFDRKHTATLTKQGLLQIEVRVNRTSQKKFISTGIRLLKNQFSDRNGFCCVNHPNAQIITGKARRIFNTVEAFVMSKECQTFADVLNWNIDNSTTYLVEEFVRNFLKNRNSSLYVIIPFINLFQPK